MSDRLGIFEVTGTTGIDTPVLACTICGSVVQYEFRHLHVEWHGKITAMEPRYA